MKFVIRHISSQRKLGFLLRRCHLHFLSLVKIPSFIYSERTLMLEICIMKSAMLYTQEEEVPDPLLRKEVF